MIFLVFVNLCASFMSDKTKTTKGRKSAGISIVDRMSHCPEMQLSRVTAACRCDRSATTSKTKCNHLGHVNRNELLIRKDKDTRP
jgi:hypothetical protein